MKREQPRAGLPSDKQLWKEFRQGSQSAYAEIYQQQVRVLFSYGCKIVDDRDLVKDGIQDLFYYLWERRSSLGDTDNIRRYLFAALRRNLVSQLRHLPHLSEAIPEEAVPSFETQWINEQVADEQQHGLQQVLRTLPERQREAIFLKYYQEMSTDEMASVMNINRRAVYKLLTKALRNLKQAWPGALTKVAMMLLCIIHCNN